MTSTPKTHSFADLLDSAERSAVFLQMRDVYDVDRDTDDYERWRATSEWRPDPASEFWAPWVDLVSRTVARGVVMRRARIVSEPVSDSMRFMHSCTVVNIGAGEDVRWLSRREASGTALPGNDFWLIDRRVIRWNHFSGPGDSVEGEMCTDPEAIELCATAFETVWQRATPHEEYRIR